ncbi:YozE family protein [Ensifer aridi]|uniref:YozE family protein n=1 Tax=Ensifer aridi TaxID=1708715 RepID=UPI0015E2F320|nr:YozE family protein [Ensifer aridi]
MSFKSYLKTRRITDTPAGDFTADALRDNNLPDAESWSELKAYLERVSRLPGVIPSGYQVWQGYQRWKKKTQ